MLSKTRVFVEKSVDRGAIQAHIYKGSKRFEEQQASET
jgi:hypothetical protein